MSNSIVQRFKGSDKLLIPIAVNGDGEGTKVQIGPDQFKVAQEWARRTAHNPNGTHKMGTVFDEYEERDVYTAALTLSWIGVLEIKRRGGYKMPASVRQHLARYGGG